MGLNTLVIGASSNKERYSFKAINSLILNKNNVFAIGIRDENISGITVYKYLKFFKKIHTVSLYVGPKNQKEYFNYVLKINPKRVIFNPGTENLEFSNFLTLNGIKCENACTLVLLSTNQY
jgi:predicted CoA-binding protein